MQRTSTEGAGREERGGGGPEVFQTYIAAREKKDT